MHTELIIQLAIVIGTATAAGILLHVLKQPLVAAYILAGVVLSFAGVHFTENNGSLELLPSIGISLLLFMIGLELDFRELKLIGKPIVLASLAQMAVTTAVVAVLITLAGFNAIDASLMGLALSFSSTIVVIKLLIDKQEISTLHGKVAIGMLLVEDLAAVVALMFLSLSSSMASLGVTQTMPYVALFVKALVLILVVLGLIKYIIPRLFSLLAHSQELLFLTAVFWCFMFATATTLMGFSLEIGAFLGGMSLASTAYRYQIAGRLKPLRDFFIAIFFVDLGMSVMFSQVVAQMGYVAMFTIFALVIKPIEILVILTVLRFRKFTAYHAATALSQISEFSVILLVAAKTQGFVSDDIIQLFTATTVITIFISSLLVSQNDRLYPIFSSVIKRFERKSSGFKHFMHDDLEDHIVLIGANRAGEPVLDFLRKKDIKNVIVVDYDPQKVRELQAEKIPVIFGDISDPEILEQLHLDKARIVISSIRELKDNLMLLEAASQQNSKAKFFIAATDDDEAVLLKHGGADEVIIPLKLEGSYIVGLLDKHWHKTEGRG